MALSPLLCLKIKIFTIMIANLGQYVKLVHIFYQLILLFKEVKGRISFKDFQGIAIPPKISIPD